MWFVVLCLFIDGAFGLFDTTDIPNAKCGVPHFPPIGQRIVGGVHAREGSWPWLAALMEQGVLTCAGTILDSHTIVTAANCVEGASLDPTRWMALAGVYDLRNPNPSTTQRVHIKAIIPHEKYNSTSLDDDLAIVKTSEPIFFNNYVMPGCLPGGGDQFYGQTCYAMGWGDTQSQLSSDILNQVDLPVLDIATCQRDDWMGTDFTPDKTLCAGYAQGGKDSCNGDGGAPLVCKKPDGVWYVAGIVSWGYDCAKPQTPGIYTNVAHYTQWIQQHMGN